MVLSPRRFGLLLSVSLALIGITVIGFGARPVVSATDSPLVNPADRSSPTAPTAAALHNPGFDNRNWYWFHERYGYGSNLQPDSFVPDDDVINGPQQWMLWFYDGTIPVLTWATSGAHEGRNAVKGRTYWGTIREDKLQAGLYQMIYDATPCLTYEFQMYVKAQMGEPNDVMYALKVGIDRRGFRPNTWAVGSFPSSTAWGAPRTDYVGFFGPLSVTAEAWDSTISVYTYAEAGGGNSVDFAWDTGSFRDATPPVIQDPDNLPPPGGIFNLSESVGSTTATISWETVDEALGQVYFRASPTEPIPPIGTNRVYLPIMIGPPVSWQWTPLNKTPTRYHTANLVDLLPGHTYEYIAVSRGLSGGQCVTWVSDVETFTTSN